MGRRLLTKAPRINETGEVLVNFAAGRVDGARSRVGDISATESCVPFGGGSPLADRKHLVITAPTEAVWLGPSGVMQSTMYPVSGAGRSDDFTAPPDLARYSNRKQFLRGQYFHLACFPAVQVCAKAPAVEDAFSLELS